MKLRPRRINVNITCSSLALLSADTEGGWHSKVLKHTLGVLNCAALSNILRELQAVLSFLLMVAAVVCDPMLSWSLHQETQTQCSASK